MYRVPSWYPAFSSLILVASILVAQPCSGLPELSIVPDATDALGDVATVRPAQKALQDTVWIADWSFDAGGVCDESGWSRIDNRILNDGVVHWRCTSAYAGSGGIVGQAVALGYTGSPCCVAPDGYDNDWYQAIRIDYTGPAALSFDYLLDSESGYDFLRVESDSLCASFARVDYAIAPAKRAASFRRVEFSASGPNTAGTLENLPLRDYGPGTHCVYVAFFSNGERSPCDGVLSTTVGAAVVVDDIMLTDAGGTRSEDFEDGSLDLGTFLNIQDSAPFGEWARTFKHVTDNDFCIENTTCAWLWTDYTTPTVANDPTMSFGPNGYVVKNWLDDIIVSPWVSLVGTPNATGTVLRYRLFPGNTFNTSRIVMGWSVRVRKTAGGTVCLSPWGHAGSFNSLGHFRWTSWDFDMSPYVESASSDIQIRFRTSDWQWITGSPAPSPFVPGPGPYVDRIRIGRRFLDGPVISEWVDARSQAQDAFPTEILPTAPGTGEHFRPSTDRFGTCAFSSAQDRGINSSWNVITGDSITVSVKDVRQAGGIAAVEWYGAIVEGPHAGKAPAPYALGASGFFKVSPFTRWGYPGDYSVDLDDTYFRGGDVLDYFWLASDVLGGVSSDPAGLVGVPASIAAAEEATGGLLEVSFLPAIDWDPAYLARIAADPHGDLAPTPAELANSTQRNCVLYVQMVNLRRRSGSANRTSFMYTLDRLGYEGHYDVYDHMGLGDTNNHLGGRASVEEAEAYSLIVYDAGNMGPGIIMPNGSVRDTQKIDQVGWFRTWLAQAGTSEAGFATLWVLGTEALEERPTAPLYSVDMGLVLVSANQALSLNPEVDGVASFTFDRGADQAVADFTTDLFQLNGGCPSIRDYDALGTNGSAVVTHRYRDPATGTLGDGAIVMNRNDALNWNTIFQSHAWMDIREPAGPPGNPELVLLDRVLDAALRSPCLQDPDPTDTGPEREETEAPRQTLLYANVPNPFNPTTTIRFDLARKGHVSLCIYDVAGHLVRRLLDADRGPARNANVVWDGLDSGGSAVASGIYFCRLETVDAVQFRKLVMLK